ncbi:MAG: serine acetyltransferase [Hymenobacteraceae bacterium]|nr:serine acetyltransferase [Hymenobacteraceae bacterium]
MDALFLTTLAAAHTTADTRGSAGLAAGWIGSLFALLFPERAVELLPAPDAIEVKHARVLRDLVHLLTSLPAALGLPASPADLAAAFADALPAIREALLADAAFLAAADPAATSAAEVISTYPGFYATAIYRVAHALYHLDVPRLPRILTEIAHSRTGIDLHPGAHIASPFGIDHGTGLVVGATAVIGQSVLLYQGVTLGAIHVEKALARQKRHPTIGDHVVIYAGATILGGSTVVGAHSIIGGNVWLTRSVPAYSRVYHRAQVDVRAAEGPAEGLMFEI